MDNISTSGDIPSAWKGLFTKYQCLVVNPSNPKIDQHLISPFSNNNCWIIHNNHENKGNDHHPEKLWMLNEFLLSVPKEMHNGYYGEYGDCYKSVKG